VSHIPVAPVEPAPGIPAPQEGAPKHEVKREIIELVKMVMLFLALFLLLKTFVVEGYEVQGPSMFPTLEDGERILVFKLPLLLSHLPLLGGMDAVGEGDIVVFESLDGSKKRYIKRVIAKGEPPRANKANATTGDTSDGVRVQFFEGEVYINQQRIDQEYLVPEERRSPDIDDNILGAGEYYVLGDHRSLSKDSRSFGPVFEKQIIGRAWLRFWPLAKFGAL
jgi:signal peptidase I